MRYRRLSEVVGLVGLVALFVWPQSVFAMDGALHGLGPLLSALGFISVASLGSMILYFYGIPSQSNFLVVRFPSWKPSWKKDLTAFLA